MQSSAENKNESGITKQQKDYYKMLEEKHISTLLSASEAYNKAVLNLSTVSLGFTFAFIEFAQPHQTFTHRELLHLSWLLLILSILFILISFVADQCLSQKKIIRYHKKSKGEVANQDCAEKFLKYIMERTPLWAGFLFLIAIICFTFFVGKNI